MSDIPLATKYSPDNYPKALSNVVTRYQRGEGEAVPYKKAAFGDISKSKASACLGFLADTGILDRPKQGNYKVSEEVINWEQKVGQTKEEAEVEVRKRLIDYEVFEDAVLVLEQEGPLPIEELSNQVAGLVGADEEELPDMERTIRVIAALGFLEISDDDIVSTRDDSQVQENLNQFKSNEKEETAQESPDETETNGGLETVEPTSKADPQPVQAEQPQRVEVTPAAQGLSADLELSLDATDMETDELQEKLEIINETLGE